MTKSTTPSNPILTRFAPSPTGLMHFGNLRVAIFNYLYAHKLAGRFLLRIEDTDIARSEIHYREALLSDLQWMGIVWDEGPFYQSERQKIYDQYYQELEAHGLVYPCFCSEEHLAITRKIQLSSGQPPRYAGTCRHLTAEEISHKKGTNIPWTLRFSIPKGQKVEFVDLIKGLQQFDTDHIGDFIVRRNDGSASFMFCNAIDDALMGVTHALRGDDHLTNTPRQILILNALNLTPPQYGHFPTILGPDSKPLSKRNGSRSIDELRETGYLPLGILNYLARLGHYDPDTKLLTLKELSEHFTLDNISHAPAHFDVAQLNHWQKEAMHHAPMDEYWKLISPHVEELVPKEKEKAFVETVQPNLMMPKEANFWAHAIFDEILSYEAPEEPEKEPGKEAEKESEKKPEKEGVKSVILETGPDFFISASEILKQNHNITYQTLIAELQQKTNRKGKALFFPLRAALTATLHGPELARILDLMGTDRARHRLLEAAHYATVTNI